VAVTSVYERDRKLLEYLEGLGVRPGSNVSVESRNADDTLTLRVDGHRVQLGRSAAQKVWVQAPTAPEKSGVRSQNKTPRCLLS